jgi:photosystem II stability/assembly factor-like uncharacterized protein
LNKTEDGGDSWQNITMCCDFLSLAIDPVNTDKLYATYDGPGIIRSTNGGLGWSGLSQGLEDITDNNCIVVDPVDRSILYLGTRDRGVYKSSNGGTSWKPFNTGIATAAIACLAVDPADHLVVYAGLDIGSSKGGVMRSSDGGRNWTLIGLSGFTVSSLAIHLQSPATVFAGTSTGGIFRLGPASDVPAVSHWGILVLVAMLSSAIRTRTAKQPDLSRSASSK